MTIINTRQDLDAIAGTGEHERFMQTLKGSLFAIRKDEVLKKWVAEESNDLIEQFGFTRAEFEPIALPQVPIYKEVDNSAQEALSEFNSSVKLLTEPAPGYESDSWVKQELEARNLSAATPLIDGLVLSRGLSETREELAAKIIANADKYTVAYASALGIYHAKIKAIK